MSAALTRTAGLTRLFSVNSTFFAVLLALFSVGVSAETPLFGEPRTAPVIGGMSAEQLQRSENALDRRLGYTLKAADSAFALIPYETNYILGTWTSDLHRSVYLTGIQSVDDDVDDLDDWETKYQISLMFPIWRNILGSSSALVASYTQLAFWQAENSDVSAPFRETNYEPQLFLVLLSDRKLLGLTWRWNELGYNHQSNGRAEEPADISRSWNRIYAKTIGARGNFALSLRAWAIIGNTDDNEDIEDFLGYYDISASYRYGNNVFSGRGHLVFGESNGSLELTWSYPLTRNVRLYTMAFTGYAESLIDYDHNQTRLGIGVSLNDIL